MEKEIKKQRWLKAAIIFLSIVAFIVSVGLGFFLRIAIVGKDAAALEEVAAYLRNFGVFNTQTLELEQFTGEDGAKLITKYLSDDYATYYTPEEYKKLNQTRAGNHSGIGVSVKSGTLTVIKVSGNSPAFHAGVKVGDELVGGVDKNGNETTFDSLADISEFLNSLTDKTFTLKAKRGAENVQFTLTVSEYKTSYLVYFDNDSRYAFVGDDFTLKKLDGKMEELATDTACIYFDTFEGSAPDELKAMFELMKSKGKTKLILDVRNNGGGYMDVLEDFAGGIIYKEGKSRLPIAYTKDSKGSYKEFKTSSSFYNGEITKISVIANENSASATECLIGAMLYYGGAFSIENLVIENDSITDGYARTYGKGIMQTTFILSNGGAVKLTTAVIYQPD
ncbi:MAG: S41 family peptidase, partial [Clostridia bacterium]|nr:S41 family peptidase [Clostridia bacterium]